MKKVISIALLLALCLSVLAGCSTPAVDFTDAINVLNVEMDAIGTKTTKAFYVLSDITIGGTTHYSVAWTSDNADVTFADDAAKPGNKKVSIPKRTTTDVSYTLTAVISDDNGNKSEALNFNLTIPAMPPLPAADSNVTIKSAIELGIAHDHDTFTENKYYITGEVVEIKDENFGNMYIQDRDGNKLYLYGTDYASLKTVPVVGDTIKVYGIIGQYNDAAQVKNSNIVEINGKASEKLPPLTLVEAPKVGVAYKFGMLQGNLGTTHYLVGGMSGFYMATTPNGQKAMDVYLETTTGGYYLYCMADGVKTYINMVVSADGQHVNGAYEAAASTVYTYDTEAKTLKASVAKGDAAAEDYWFGTRNDKTYTTVGPCAVSYEGFYCQFYN